MPIHTLPTFQVQCLAGHVYNAAPSSALETQCSERRVRGYLDALILPPDECEDCLNDSISRARRTYEAICGDWGCMGDCGSPDPDNCRGRDDIVKYQALLTAAEKRNRPPVAA